MVFENEEGFSNQLGFIIGKSGPHLARSLMQDELFAYLNYAYEHPDRSYKESIIEDNCLNKSTLKNRTLTAKHLDQMYGLEKSPAVTVGLKYFLKYENEVPELAALLCALSRDPVLRSTAEFILEFKEGESVLRSDTEKYIDRLERGRFSPAMLKSLAMNINGSWTFAGYLKGKNKKVRSKVKVTPAIASYAAYLSTLAGRSGVRLLQSDFYKILECSENEALDLLREASRAGIITLNKIGQIMEVSFTNLNK